MQAWSASALRAYYADPLVGFRESAHRDGERATVTGAGFYIDLHCQPGCCSALGLPNQIGPFTTAALARAWSRKHLRDVVDAAPKH